MCYLCEKVQSLLPNIESAVAAIKAQPPETRADFWDHQFEYCSPWPTDSSPMLDAVNHDAALVREIEEGLQRFLKRQRDGWIAEVAEHDRLIQSLNASISASELRLQSA